MQEKEADREARLRELASKLFFTLKNQGLRFSLYRDVDVPEPIRHDGLSLDHFVARMVADAAPPGLCTDAARRRCSPRQRAEKKTTWPRG